MLYFAIEEGRHGISSMKSVYIHRDCHYAIYTAVRIEYKIKLTHQDPASHCR
jgi:hypothetical protein